MRIERLSLGDKAYLRKGGPVICDQRDLLDFALHEVKHGYPVPAERIHPASWERVTDRARL